MLTAKTIINNAFGINPFTAVTAVQRFVESPHENRLYLLNSSPFKWECLLDSDYNRFFFYCKDNMITEIKREQKTGKEYQHCLKIENN